MALIDKIDYLPDPCPPHCHRCRHHVGVFASFCSRLGSTRIPDESKPPEWCPGFEDAQASTDAPTYAPGDRVRHGGTLQWGKVIEAKTEPWGIELVVERIVRHEGDLEGIGQWEARRCDRHKPAIQSPVPEDQGAGGA